MLRPFRSNSIYTGECHGCRRDFEVPCHLVARTEDGERAECPRCGAALVIQFGAAAKELDAAVAA